MRQSRKGKRGMRVLLYRSRASAAVAAGVLAMAMTIALAPAPASAAITFQFIPGSLLDSLGVACPTSSTCYAVGDPSAQTPPAYVVPITNGSPGTPVAVSETYFL